MMRTTEHEKRIAKALGVTPIGLQVLARMVAGGGTGRTAGMAGVRLIKQGLVAESERNFGCHVPPAITDAGREIVRRAREMGW